MNCPTCGRAPSERFGEDFAKCEYPGDGETYGPMVEYVPTGYVTARCPDPIHDLADGLVEEHLSGSGRREPECLDCGGSQDAPKDVAAEDEYGVPQTVRCPRPFHDAAIVRRESEAELDSDFAQFVTKSILEVQRECESYAAKHPQGSEERKHWDGCAWGAARCLDRIQIARAALGDDQ